MTIKFSPKYLTHILIGLTASVAGTTWSTASRAASMINVELPYNKYGHESNIGGRCAATSMINSFVYLSNTSKIYKNTALLTGSDMNNTLQDSIIELDTLMGGKGCGVSDQEAWEGKLEWFELYAPNTTTFAGMVDLDFTDWEGNQFLTRGVPTIDFLLDELRDGEDVEVGFGFDLTPEEEPDPTKRRSGHWITLTSLHIDDMNMNGMWDFGEMTLIDYIDPNCPAGTGPNPAPSVVELSPDGKQFKWSNCGGIAERMVDIEVAFAESPRVPEPSFVFGLLAVSGLGLSRIGKKRK